MSDLFVVAKPVRASGLPPDWKAREAALDVGHSFIVEAPAGSGKTGLLLQRFLKLLGQEGVTEPEQVLAITFTRRAVQEIHERVLEQLEAAAGDAPLKRDGVFERLTRELARAVLLRDQALGWGLLAHPKRLRVQTIDSVCAEIARSLPVLSGSGGGLTPVEDAGPLYGDAARRTLMQLGGGDTALHEALERLLLHRDGSLDDCERLIGQMLARREQWAEFVPLSGTQMSEVYLDGTMLPKVERALEVAICTGLTRAAKLIPPALLQSLTTLACEMAEHDHGCSDEAPLAVCRNLRLAPQTAAEDVAHWRALAHLLLTKDGSWRADRGLSGRNLKLAELLKNHAAELKSILGEFRVNDASREAMLNLRSLPPSKYPAEQWQEAKALFRVLRHALAELTVVFARRGECDFTELTLRAKDALRVGGASEMTAALGLRLEHLLVDEMQDTSTSHYEVIELLTAGWDGVGQTVFLVGDPKQSIYMFRQARVELFLRTMREQRLGDLPLGVLRLTANFRSQEALVRAFNADFERLFTDDVAYVEAVAVRPVAAFAEEQESVQWHTNPLPSGLGPDEKREGRQHQKSEDARTVRAVVEHWRATMRPDGTPWKIAVLVRNRKHLLEVVAELKRGAVPYRAVDIDPLGDRQEVLDLVTVTRALLHPADRVAWLALLRAPWCGMALADLHQLAGADERVWRKRTVAQAMRARGELLSEDGIERLQRVWQVMEAAETQRGRIATSEWVERTWRTLGGDVFLGEEELANAKRFLQLLDALEAETGRIDLAILQGRMEQLFAETPVRPDAVELLTIHKAKGLEWDVVLVPALELKSGSDGRTLLTWEEMDSHEEGEAHVVLAPIEGKGADSAALNSWLRGIRKKREAAERRRLFYVACTRAREQLHLLAAPETKDDGGISKAAGSLLEAAWPAAEEHFGAGNGAKLFVLPPAAVPGAGLAIAAGAAVTGLARLTVQRLPAEFDTAARFRGVTALFAGGEDEVRVGGEFDRPEGSFAARSYGNAVHGFVEWMTRRAADGVSIAALGAEVAGWGPRIEAVLRGDGLPGNLVKKLAKQLRGALETMLGDEVGGWILAATNDASSELALTTWGKQRSSVRLDRVFRAGAEPLSAGDDCLWVVDYKTATHGGGGVDEFLTREKAKYVGQLDTYARVLGGDVRVGLYYPGLGRLVWWVCRAEDS